MSSHPPKFAKISTSGIAGVSLILRPPQNPVGFLKKAREGTQLRCPSWSLLTSSLCPAVKSLSLVSLCFHAQPEEKHFFFYHCEQRSLKLASLDSSFTPPKILSPFWAKSPHIAEPKPCQAFSLPPTSPGAYSSLREFTLPLLSLFLMATIRVSSMKSPRWSWKNLTQTTIRKSTCLLKEGSSGPFYFETVQQTAEKTMSGKKRDFVYD